jgi:hypothetical protein
VIDVPGRADDDVLHGGSFSSYYRPPLSQPWGIMVA